MSMSEMLADIARLDREAMHVLIAMPNKHDFTPNEFAALSRARSRLLDSAVEGERLAADALKEEQQGVRA